MTFCDRSSYVDSYREFLKDPGTGNGSYPDFLKNPGMGSSPGSFRDRTTQDYSYREFRKNPGTESWKVGATALSIVVDVRYPQRELRTQPVLEASSCGAWQGGGRWKNVRMPHEPRHLTAQSRLSPPKRPQVGTLWVGTLSLIPNWHLFFVP